MSERRNDSAVVTLVRSDTADGVETSAAADQIRASSLLRELCDRLYNGREQTLRRGDLAQWKPGLRNRRSPAYGQPVVIIGTIDPPILDQSFESGSPYFREPLSVLVGIADEDGELLVHHCDIRRFEPYALAEQSQCTEPRFVVDAQ